MKKYCVKFYETVFYQVIVDVEDGENPEDLALDAEPQITGAEDHTLISIEEVVE